jgi:hypothetical protein
VGAEGGFVSDEEADLSLTGDDIKELKKWYKDICGEGNEEARFWEFLGKDPTYGSNHRVLGRFFKHKDKPGNSAKHEFFLKVYHHQVCGDRADSENWYWQLAFLVGLLGLALVVGLDFLQRIHAEEWDSLSWLKFFVFFAVAGLAITFFNFGNKIVKLLRRLK